MKKVKMLKDLIKATETMNRSWIEMLERAQKAKTADKKAA